MYVNGGNDDDREAVLAAVLAAADASEDADASEGADATIQAEEAAPLVSSVLAIEGPADSEGAGVLPCVGAEIEVLWEHESQWFRGHVSAIDLDRQDSFQVHYVDGDIGWEDLGGTDEWRYPEAEEGESELPESELPAEPRPQQHQPEASQGINSQSWDQWSRGIRATPWHVDAREYKWQDRIANAVQIEVGSSQLAMQYYQLFNKFRLVRKLYQPTRAMCKHEVAIHEVRAISLGNWFPCKWVLHSCASACAACSTYFFCVRSFPNESITPKFHIITYEHTRIMKAVGSCGDSTEEGVEGLHRDSNGHDNLVCNIQNDNQRLDMMVHTQHNRANATKQLSLKTRGLS